MTASPVSREQAPPRTINRINRFETYIWRYMRLSALLLIPLVFVHLVLMHLDKGVHEMDYEWVILERWSSTAWRIYDAFLLWFAGFHGLFGLRYIISDYAGNPRVRRALIVIVAAFMVIAFTLGTIALLFAPQTPVVLD